MKNQVIARRGRKLFGRLTVVAVLFLGLGPSSSAVDGVIEVNDLDFPGTLVLITEPGSYRLTSDIVRTDIRVIFISADNVTLDLNGFSLVGGGVGSGLHDGIFINNHKNIEIRNGTIRDMGRHGIFATSTTSEIRVIDVRSVNNGFAGYYLLGSENFVDRCTAMNNGLEGFQVEGRSLVINSFAHGNANEGLDGGTTTGYRSNIFTENNGGNANPQVSDGIQLGANICATNTTCP